MDTLTLYAFVLLALTILLVGLTGYLMGSSRSARRQLSERARREEIAHELTHDEPAYDPQLDATAVEFEVVDLPPVTAPLAIIAPPTFTALPELEVEPDPVEVSAAQSLADEREALLREIEELRTELAHKEALRLRYLRQARAQTERVNFMLRLFADARRPPSKQALSSVKIALPRGKQLALVPPSIASEWSELS
ncbi:MAG: hypothetical protein JWP85_2173 [Rhodoglobus sp.]|nr:hypothetical protein [Rhodoglobus sp.]